MRILSIFLGLVMITAISGCLGGSVGSDATSELLIYNDLTGALIADGSADGAITLNLGDTREIRVMRRVIDEDQGTTSTNVTADADYNVSNTNVIAVADGGSATPGVITATAVGTTQLEVIFREGNDPSNDDSANITVNVLP